MYIYSINGKQHKIINTEQIIEISIIKQTGKQTYALVGLTRNDNNIIIQTGTEQEMKTQLYNIYNNIYKNKKTMQIFNAF